MKLSKIMVRAKLVKGLSYMTLHVNLSGISEVTDIDEIYNYALSFVSKLPPDSLTLLFDLSGLNDSTVIRTKLEEMTIDSSKYFVQTALVTDNEVGNHYKGIIQKHGLSDVIRYFTSVDAAKDYILTYKDHADLRRTA